jgi:hypothetical protein
MSEKTVGSKAEVFHGTAKHTSGGLTRKDLMRTKAGRIVSRKKHAAGKKAIQRLFKLGYKPKKGSFGLFHKGTRKASRKAGRKARGTRRRGGYRGGYGGYGSGSTTAGAAELKQM